jgi:nicotinamide mononucleotide transporter
VDTIEATAALLVIVNVALVARRSVWNYPFAIVAVAIYAVIFFRARLYSDTILQGFFVAVNLYGWVHWSRVKAEVGEVAVETMAPPARIGWLAGCVAATLAWGTLMHRYTDATHPWWDAGIAITSIAAQTLQARRLIENWWLWILVDVASIPLYAIKGLWFTCALYGVLLLISAAGLFDWRRSLGRAARMVPA